MSDPPASPDPAAAKAEADFKLWSKYEDIAMHFNDLNMRWRLQAMGGLATLVTLGGFAVGDIATFAVRYRGMLIISTTLMFAWVGIAVLDLVYYRRLLHGAVAAIVAFEADKPIKLSSRIDAQAKWGARFGPMLFYFLGFVPLAGITFWALHQLGHAPPEERPSTPPTLCLSCSSAAPNAIEP